MIAIRIPQALHNAIPQDISVSSLVRQLLEQAVDNPGTVVAAMQTRLDFEPCTDPAQRYSVYLPEREKDEATPVAERFLLSLNQLIQILLEDTLHRAGVWPPASAAPEPTEPKEGSSNA